MLITYGYDSITIIRLASCNPSYRDVVVAPSVFRETCMQGSLYHLLIIMLSESETINDAVTFCKKIIHRYFHDLDFHNFERDFGSGRSTINSIEKHS